MSADSAMKWLLRFIGITTIPAFVAAVMPQAWFVYLIQKAEPGMPVGILVTYLGPYYHTAHGERMLDFREGVELSARIQTKRRSAARGRAQSE